MLEALFFPGTWHDTLYRRNMKIEAKLVLVICVHKIIPHRGNKVEVRYPEVPILYTLLHGAPLFPFRFLSKRYHKLKSEGQRWRALKVDARPLNSGEADGSESANEPQSGDDDYADDPNVEAMEVEEGSSSRGGRRRGGPTQPIFTRGVFDYTRQQIDPNWAHYGTIQEVVGNARPPTFTDWAEPTQTFFDDQTFVSASMEQLMKQNYDIQEQWNCTRAYAFKQEMNNRYLDDRNWCIHDAWHAGQPVVADPLIVDYSTIPPYDGSVPYPTPPLHYSMWVDPRQAEGMQASSQQAGEGGDEGGSSSGAFGFGEFSDMMTSIFGPPQLLYY
ncbi:hypothetical protein Hanom_Chr15g01362661 [Helianthus anomalus]